jgi:hypothetical protein
MPEPPERRRWHGSWFFDGDDAGGTRTMNIEKKRFFWLPVAAALVGGSAFAKTYIYPQKGQSSQQQNKDKAACQQWATEESGFDPLETPPPPPQAPPPPGRASQQPGVMSKPNAVRGAAGGAALGAIGGAIGGDAGKGAAIGAGVGAAGGAIRRRNQIREEDVQQQQYQQNVAAQRRQHDANIQAQRNEFNKAFAACMEARGYSLK